MTAPIPKKRPVLFDHFFRTATRMTAEYELSKNLNASSNLGTVRESFCSGFLIDHLPPRLRVKSGEIWDSEGNKSGQLDVIVVRDDAPTLHYSNDANAYMVEGVFAVVEVKSVLDRKELRKSLTTLSKAHSLVQTSGVTLSMGVSLPPLGRPLHIIFAYESAGWDTLEDELRQSNSWQTFDMIAVLNRGVLARNKGVLVNDKLPQHGWLITQGKAAALAYLYALFVAYASSFAAKSFDIYPYLEGFWDWEA